MVDRYIAIGGHVFKIASGPQKRPLARAPKKRKAKRRKPSKTPRKRTLRLPARGGGAFEIEGAEARSGIASHRSERFARLYDITHLGTGTRLTGGYDKATARLVADMFRDRMPAHIKASHDVDTVTDWQFRTDEGRALWHDMMAVRR